MAFSSRTQNDYADLMRNACYVMCVAYGKHEDFLALLSKGLKEGSVLPTGWVNSAGQLSGMKVSKIQFPTVYSGPQPKFVVLELDGGKHFVVGKPGSEKLVAPTDKEGWVDYDPAGVSKSRTITGLRVFY